MSLPAVSRHPKVREHAPLISRGRDAQWRPARLDDYLSELQRTEKSHARNRKKRR